MAETEFNYQHLLLIEDAQGIRTIKLTEDVYSIGRSAYCKIIINEPQISRYHATLIKQKEISSARDGYFIIDGDLKGNKSKNGVFVNGVYQSSYYLKDEDLIDLRNPQKLDPKTQFKYLIIPLKVSEDLASSALENNFRSNSELISKTNSQKDLA